jgi:hypothetical protein
MGRSIGSAPAIHLAAVRRPKFLITISAFATIKQVIQDQISFLGSIVSNKYFDNISNAR